MRTFLCLAPALGLILFITSYRSALFHTAKYQKVAAQLLANETYYGNIDFDERALQILMAERLPRDIETLVVGSSRTMQLQGNCFATKSYNASVSGAMLSDLAAILEAFRRNGHKPNHVILAADPWMLNAHEQAAAWNASPAVPNLIRIQAAPDWLRAQLRLGLTPHLEDWVAAARAIVDPFGELLSPANFHAALEPYNAPGSFRKQPDGSLTYPPNWPAPQDAIILRTAYEHSFERIDPFLAHAFEALIRSLDAKVTLVLAPFHPLYYNRMAPILPAAEAYFRSLNVETKGSYASNARMQFLDAVHLTKSSLAELYGCPPVIE